MTFYIFSQGTLASADEVNNNINKGFKLQGEKAINDVSATNSGVLAGSSQVLIDKFLDSNGQNNTVDTVNTTCQYQPEKYTCAVSTSTSTENAIAMEDGSSSGSGSGGHKIYTNSACVLRFVTKDNNSVATTCYLKAADGTILSTATYSGDVATFYYPLAAATYYRLENYKSGNWSRRRKSFPDYPINNTYINFTQGSSNGVDIGTAFEIESLSVYTDDDLTYTDATIQSFATTIPTGMTKVFVTPLMYEALAAGDNITADVSIDNGAHYTTAVPINTWSPITSTNGTSLIVKANLLTNDGTTTPKVSGWRVLLE